MRAPGESADPIGDRRAFAGRRHRASLSRPGAVQAGARLRGVLPVLLPPRNGRPGQGDRAVAGRLSRRARLYPRASGNLGSDPDRRRSPDAVAAAARRDHGGSRRASITSRSSASTPACRWPIPRASAREMVAALKVEGATTWVALHANHPRELTAAARAACARHRRCRHSDGQPVGAAARRQRRCGDAGGADARPSSNAGSSPITCITAISRPGTAHLRTTLEHGPGTDAALAGAGFRPVPAGLCARYSRRPRQGAGRPELFVAGKFVIEKVNWTRKRAIVSSTIAATFISIRRSRDRR